MLGRLQGFGVALFSAMLASAACSDSESNGNGGGGKTSEGGEGGEATSGGKGGQSGGSGKGGSGGKVSVMGGAGGAGGAAEPACPGCASGFCLRDRTCVDCLATDDQCPLGQYCTETNTCIARLERTTSLGNRAAPPKTGRKIAPHRLFAVPDPHFAKNFFSSELTKWPRG